MNVSDVMVKMAGSSNGNRRDISHFLKVYAYAKTIAEQENVPAAEQKVIEIAAIVHDIACPLCREKYGNTSGKLQEAEGGGADEGVFQRLGLAGGNGGADRISGRAPPHP